MSPPKTPLTTPTRKFIEKLREAADVVEGLKDIVAAGLVEALDVHTTPPTKRSRRTQQICDLWDEHQEAVEEVLDVLNLTMDWARELSDTIDKHYKKKVR